MDKLEDFKEGQWWVKELDAMAQAETATPDQKRAVAVVHNMLRVAERYMGVVRGIVELPISPVHGQLVAFSTEGQEAVTHYGHVVCRVGDKWRVQMHNGTQTFRFDPVTGYANPNGVRMRLRWASNPSNYADFKPLCYNDAMVKINEQLKEHNGNNT